MNSLSIVARAVLMEAEGEGRGRKYARRAAIGVGAAGAGAAGMVGAGAAHGAYKAASGARGAGAKAGAGRVLRHMAHPVRAMKAIGRKIAHSKAGKYVSGHVGRVVGEHPIYDKVSGEFTPGSGLRGLATNHPGAMAHLKTAGKVGAAGLAGYAGYRAYKHLKAKRAAKEAAREAYFATYNRLMEADEPESSAKKWGKRGLMAAGGLAAAGVGGMGALGAARGARAALSNANWTAGKVGTAMARGAKSHILNAGAVTRGIVKRGGRKAAEGIGAFNDIVKGGHGYGAAVRGGLNAAKLAK